MPLTPTASVTAGIEARILHHSPTIQGDAHSDSKAQVTAADQQEI